MGAVGCYRCGGGFIVPVRSLGGIGKLMDILKILGGLVDVFRWRGKKKKEGKREKAINAVIANELHNARLRKDGRKRNSDNR